MAQMTPQEFREKQARRLKGSLDDVRRGVERVTEAPGKKAAAKQDKMLAGVTEAITSGKWARNVGAVTLEDWKGQMLNKGVNRISAGIDAAAPKVERFAEQFLPFQESISKKVQAMPDLTLEDSIARMTTQVRETAKFRFNK